MVFGSAKSCGVRVGVPSRGFCFLGKTWPGKSHVSRVGVPSRGFCFLITTCPEKSSVSRVAVPSRGFCFFEKTCSGKKLYILGRIHWDRLDAFPLLPIFKGRVGSPNKRPAPISMQSNHHRTWAGITARGRYTASLSWPSRCDDEQLGVEVVLRKYRTARQAMLSTIP